MTKKKSGSESMVSSMMNMGVTNLVGVGMIGATAGMVNTLPAGVTKDIAGMAPALQSTALVGANLGMVKKSMGKSTGSKKDKFW